MCTVLWIYTLSTQFLTSGQTYKVVSQVPMRPQYEQIKIRSVWLWWVHFSSLDAYVRACKIINIYVKLTVNSRTQWTPSATTSMHTYFITENIIMNGLQILQFNIYSISINDHHSDVRVIYGLGVITCPSSRIFMFVILN